MFSPRDEKSSSLTSIIVDGYRQLIFEQVKTNFQGPPNSGVSVAGDSVVGQAQRPNPQNLFVIDLQKKAEIILQSECDTRASERVRQAQVHETNMMKSVFEFFRGIYQPLMRLMVQPRPGRFCINNNNPEVFDNVDVEIAGAPEAELRKSREYVPPVCKQCVNI